MSTSITKRGLLAPQNTFLDTLLKTISPDQSKFVVANARLEDFPIVHVSDAFAKMFGYSKSEIMFQSAKCTFMRPQIEDDSDQLEGNLEVEQRLEILFNAGCRESIEMPVQVKDKSTIWVTFFVSPIYDEKETIAFYLCWVKALSRNRARTDEVHIPSFKGMGKFARLAKSVTAARKAVGEKQNVVHPTDMDLPSVAAISENSDSQRVLPRYMREAPQVPPYTILHTSSFKQTWNWTIFILTVYTALAAPFELVVVTDRDQNLYTQIVNLCVDTAFIMDIVICFRTTYVDDGLEVVSSGKMIRQNYLKGWFFLDFISSAPLEMVDIAYGQTHAGDSNIISNLRVLKLVRLLRLFRVLRTADHYMEYAGGQLLMFLSIFILIAHWFALGYFALGMSELDMSHCWLNLMDESFGEDRYQCCSFNSNSNSSSMEQVIVGYISSLYFTISSMTTIGFGNIAGNTDHEKLFCIVLMFFGSLLYAMIFGNITTIFQQMSSQTTKYINTLKSIRDFMKIYHVPKDLSERVMDYVISTWTLNKGVNTEQVLSYTPKDMRADLCIHLNRQVLHEHPAFRLASEGCLRALAIAFQMQHNAPGDLLFHTGESIEDLCFIANGSMEVLQDDEIVALVGKGDVIGDKFWEEHSVGQSACTVRAMTYTNSHIISRESLLQILHFYDGFRCSFERNMILTYNLRRHFAFKKVEEHEMEKKIEGARQEKERLEDMSNDHPVRKILKGLRERIAREVYQNSADQDEESTGPSDSTEKTAPTQESLLSEDDLQSLNEGKALKHSKSVPACNEDPIIASLSNGSIPMSQRKSLLIKSFSRSCSNLSGSSIASGSSAASEAGILETARSPRNIWDKLHSPSSRKRLAAASGSGSGEVSNFPNSVSRLLQKVPGKSRLSAMDSFKVLTSPRDSTEPDKAEARTVRSAGTSSVRLRKAPASFLSKKPIPDPTEQNREMTYEEKTMPHLREAFELNHPVLNDMLKLRREYVEDLKRNAERTERINRCLWDAIIALENRRKPQAQPKQKISKNSKDVPLSSTEA